MMHSRSLAFALALASGALTSVTAQDIAHGESLHGSLGATDPIGSLGTAADTFALAVEAGEAVGLSLVTDSIEATLLVETPEGVLIESTDTLMAEAALTFTPAESGTATVTVTSYVQADGAPYTLEAFDPTPPALGVGSPVTGVSSMQPEIVFAEVEAGQPLRLTLEHDGDAGFLMITTPGDEPVETANMMGGPVRAHLVPSQSGRAVIQHLSGTMAGDSANYTLSLEPFEATGSLALADGGGELSGTLESEGTEIITLSGPAGEMVVVELTSGDFDTVLEVIGTGEMLFNDDTGSGTDSALRFRLPESGEATAIVTAFDSSTGGEYAMEITSVGPLMAPAFELETLDRETVSSADFEGDVVIVDFWASWCPPCVEEVPHFVDLQERYGDQGLSVVGVTTGDDDLAAIREFCDGAGVNYPIVMDDQRTSEDYGTLLPSGLMTAIPTTFIVDREGEVVEIFEGYRDLATLEAAVTPLL